MRALHAALLISVLFLQIFATLAFADDCPPGTVQIGETREETADEIIIHPICKRQKPPKPSAAECEAARHQAERDRAEIERNMRSTEASQEELAEWTKLGRKAQLDTLKAAVVYIVGRYGDDVVATSSSVSDLESEAEKLAGRYADKSGNFGQRMSYLKKLRETQKKLRVPHAIDYTRYLSSRATSTEQAWSIARNTMHDEFRVAAKHNADMREVLRDPGFRDAFTGDDIDTPALDVMSSLTETALENADRLDVVLEQYGALLGPTVKTAVFARDIIYNGLLFSYSAEAVDRQDEVAGLLAKASMALQKKYKKTVDTLHACKAS